MDGGAGYDWGEVYGYFTVDNPHKSYNDDGPNSQRYVAYVDYDYKLKNKLHFHLQNYFLKSSNFYVNDLTLGLSYKISSNNGFWIKPFLGVHHTKDSYFDGINGYMGGWVFDFPFKIGNEQFSVFQWNEIEFGRKDNFFQLEDGTPIGDGKSYGLNGAISIRWQIHTQLSTAVEYRYAEHKLGNIGYQSALVYTLKYHF